MTFEMIENGIGVERGRWKMEEVRLGRSCMAATICNIDSYVRLFRVNLSHTQNPKHQAKRRVVCTIAIAGKRMERVSVSDQANRSE